jgi:hypothetical protein
MIKPNQIDWRSNFVVEVPENKNINGRNICKGQAAYRTTSTIQDTIEITFPEPSATAFFLSIAKKSFDNAQQLYKHAIKPNYQDDYTQLFDFLEYSISSVNFSFNALESYANNRIIEDTFYEKKLKSGVYGALSSEKIEWLSLDEKLGDVLPQQLKISTPKGTQIWEYYIKLRKLRNKIVHITKENLQRSNHLKNMHPKNIWTELLETHNLKHPEVSLNMILHFENDQNLPHWLKYNPIKIV